MGKRRTPEEIARIKEQKEQARQLREEAKQRALITKWNLWGANYYSLYTACIKCGEMEFCRAKDREKMLCRYCHFGIEREENAATLRRVPITA